MTRASDLDNEMLGDVEDGGYFENQVNTVNDAETILAPMIPTMPPSFALLSKFDPTPVTRLFIRGMRHNWTPPMRGTCPYKTHSREDPVDRWCIQ